MTQSDRTQERLGQHREAVEVLADIRSLVTVWERSPLEKVRALAADMRAVLDAERGQR